MSGSWQGKLAAGCCAMAAALVACSPAHQGNTGIYMLLDTSGTYAQELDKAEQIIRHTLSRLEAQEGLDSEPVSMAPMLSALRREAMALSQGQHQVSIDDSAGIDLDGSTRELHSAFSNLVANAVRYTPTGGTITVHFRLDGDEPVLTVRDTGHGIPADHLPRLTERFYRVSTSRSRESGGTGLGLAIAKHVLTLHQARLEISSEVGRGSEFACRFSPARARPRDVQ